MDLCAELTVRCIRLAQEHNNPRSVLARWYFFPNYHPLSWDEARTLLTDALKPLLVAPLLEPGALAVWSLTELALPARQKLEHAIANQVEFYDGKLRHLGIAEESSFSLCTPAGEFSLPIAEFRRWTREYSLAVGVSIAKSATDGLHLLVRPPGGGRPLGLPEDFRYAAG